MRERIQRAKTVGTNTWIEGTYFPPENTMISHELSVFNYAYMDYVVVPETVGDYTGIVDKHGTRVFEGDIVKTKYGRLCIVVWFFSPSHNGWDLQPINTVENCLHMKCPDAYDLYREENLEVVGNVHDNPELLEDN